METLKNISLIISLLISSFTLTTLLITPLRKKLLTSEEDEETKRCDLRGQIIHVYYTHKNDKVIPHFEYQHLIYCYRQYKKLHGNSFIDEIMEKMKDWDITPEI